MTIRTAIAFALILCTLMGPTANAAAAVSQGGMRMAPDCAHCETTSSHAGNEASMHASASDSCCDSTAHVLVASIPECICTIAPAPTRANAAVEPTTQRTVRTAAALLPHHPAVTNTIDTKDFLAARAPSRDGLPPGTPLFLVTMTFRT